MNLSIIFSNFQGELAALLAAFCWAIASTVYGYLGQKIPPVGLNLLKGILAIALLLLTLFIQSFFKLDPNLLQWNTVSLGLLMLSGVIGIAIGDTAFFSCLNRLGTRKALLLETLAPPLTAILALIFLNENLSMITWSGILLTVLGIAWVITERVSDQTVTPSNLGQGLGFGLLAALCQATGATLSRLALTQMEISPLWSTLWRMLGGVSVLLFCVPFYRPTVHLMFNAIKSKSFFGVILATTFLGTYLGIWLQQTSLKFTEAGIAQALSSTSPLLILPIVAILGEQVSFRAILGVMISLAGIALIFQG